MSGIVKSFKNLQAKINANVKVKKRNILLYVAIFLIFLLAIGIRLSPLIRGEMLIKAFDPWIQYYNAQFIADHTLYEYFHWHDLKSWNYNGGVDRFALFPGLNFTSVAFYKILNFLGFSVDVYTVCYFFPAFMGGLTVLAIYFLGKEVLDEKCGLFAAFFLALSPGHIQRTVAGFYDNETIGVFAILMVFLFFLKTIRTGKISYSILGGMFVGYLNLSWGGATFIDYIIPLIVLLLIIMNKYDRKVLIAYAGIQGTGIIISSMYVYFNYGDLFNSLEIGGMFLFTILLILYHRFYLKRGEYPKLYKKSMSIFKWLLIPGTIVVAIIIWAYPDLIPFGFGDKFQSILNPLIRESIAFYASVAEHAPSAWSSIYYNTLIPLMLIPLGVYFCFRRNIAADVFLLVYILLAFYFTSSMTRIILVFAPAAALIGSYGLVNVLKVFGSYLGEKKVGFSKKRRKLSRKTKMMGKTEIVGVYVLVGFLCIAQIVHTTDVATTQMSYSQLTPGGALYDWQESLMWMRSNLPGDTVVVSWWDYGYWLTPIGNVTTVCDNNNLHVSTDGLVGMSFMQTNELYSAEILRLLGADYVLVYFGYFYNALGGDEGKWQWMLRICNNHYEKYLKMGLWKPNWAYNSVFDESEYVNQTSGKYRDKWFDSTLVKLLFQGLPTRNTGQFQQGTIIYNFLQQLYNLDDSGNTWLSHIPTDSFGYANYDLKTLDLAHLSPNGLVKIYKVDYSALESDISLDNPKVFNNGYGICDVKNTGLEDVFISKVSINGIEYNHILDNSSDFKLTAGEEDTILIDTVSKGTIFNESDTAQITVTAQTEDFVFTESTSNLFVQEPSGEVKILREGSKVVFNETTGKHDVYLQVKNTGTDMVLLSNFYINSPAFGFGDVEFLEGNFLLQPNEDSLAYLTNPSVSFSPVGTINNISVVTWSNFTDTTLFSSNIQNENFEYGLRILPEERIISPELSTQTNETSRIHIPMTNNTYAKLNDTTSIQLKIKNTGNNIFTLSEIELLDNLWTSIDTSEYDWAPIDGDYFISKDEEKLVEINITENLFDLNNEVGVKIIGLFDGDRVASDCGFLHFMNSTADLEIIEQVNGFNATFVYNNTVGNILIKNVGNHSLTIDLSTSHSILVNSSAVLDKTFLQGDSFLDIQDTALISFKINETAVGELEVGDVITIKVQTEEGIFETIQIIIKEKNE
ncbi:MAG: Oligosaccharyl transferase STT3 subunit [Promethearchaeota archaeon]|nr:MAG: Oligosaccharyl transferase STT3 subunit [Candidatus Lokiarchaeota archaeon]